jgi:Raf kinase inhibitor-like YbhB/YbcL family protein
MTESQKLAVLREKLIHQRRAIIERLQNASVDQLGSDDLARIQSTIDAIDEALTDERQAEFRLWTYLLKRWCVKTPPARHQQIHLQKLYDDDQSRDDLLMIGHWLRWIRAGDHHLACNDPRIRATSAPILLTSPAFDDGAAIPARHAGAGLGENLSPPLEWSGVPPWTSELVLVMQDPDAPLPRPVVHLIATGIPGDCQALGEGLLTPGVTQNLTFGRGSFGRIGYSGPRPIPGHGPHRYVFQIFALAGRLRVPPRADLCVIKTAMKGFVLAHGTLSGVYDRR